MRGRALPRLLFVGGVSAAAFGSILACNDILGITDVQSRTIKKKPDAAKPDDVAQTDTPEEDVIAPPVRPNLFQVALGTAHTCARKIDGTVRCWGDDVQGQLGGGSLSPQGFTATPQDVQNVTDAIDITAGSSHTCIVHKTGTVSCWGFNLDGQLGSDNPNLGRSAAPIDVSNLTNVFTVAAGGNFTCAVRGGGTVACWGANGSGQLGKGDDSPSTFPVLVPNVTGVVSIAAGQSHVCVAKSSGAVMCWGDGQYGQLGRAGGSATAVAVDSITNAVAVAAGERWSCAILQTGAVMCWGANEHGQLGNGTSTTDPTPIPVAVTNLTDAAALAGGTNHMCASRKSGAVACWGGGGSGQLGDGVTRAEADPQSSIVAPSAITGAVTAGGGGKHSCATTSSNQVLCWGANDRGQLGTSNTTPSPTPTTVVGYP